MKSLNDKYTQQVRNQIEFMLRGFNISESDANTISNELISRYSMIKRRHPLHD